MQQKHADRAVSEFCIRTTPEGIKSFGNLLHKFSKLEHRRLLWANDEATVDNELINKDLRTADPVRSAMASLPGYKPQDVDPHFRF